MGSARSISRLVGGLVVGIALLGSSSNANAAGLLTPKDSSIPAMEIKDHNVKVVIEDGYAITRIDRCID